MERKPVILLADESDFFLGLQRQFLRDSQVKVITLQSADSVEPHARQLRPALIVMDRFAPGYEGMLCCARLKGDPGTREIPVVLLVAEKDAHERELALKSGCDGLLTKPLERNAYLAMGRRFLPAIDRRMRRVLCHASVFFSTVSGSDYGHTVDISIGGVFIESRCPVKTGDHLKLSFALPGTNSGLIEVEGQVAWINPVEKPVRSSYPPGFGVRFEQVDPTALAAIQNYVESQPDTWQRPGARSVGLGWQAFLPPPEESAAGLFSSR